MLSTVIQPSQVKALRAVRGDAKVIVVSGDPAPEGVLEAMREHAFAYFRSPIDPDEVVVAIGRAFGAPDWQDGIEVVSARPGWITLLLRREPVRGMSTPACFESS